MIQNTYVRNCMAYLLLEMGDKVSELQVFLVYGHVLGREIGVCV